jgi:hypothetical protein
MELSVARISKQVMQMATVEEHREYIQRIGLQVTLL